MRRLTVTKSTVACLILSLATVAEAGTIQTDRPAERNSWRLAVGPIAGTLAFDQQLADYRWDTEPTMQSGAQMTFYRGRFGAGARLWRASTVQATGIPGETAMPRVNLTSFEVLGQIRALTIWNIELCGSGHAGRLHLGYSPDQMTFDSGGGPEPITIRYDPIDEWELGLGLETRRELTEWLALSLQAEGSTFALDTAHRRGDEIALSRDRFYSWSLRVQVSWIIGLGS